MTTNKHAVSEPWFKESDPACSIAFFYSLVIRSPIFRDTGPSVLKLVVQCMEKRDVGVGYLFVVSKKVLML